MIIGLIGPIGAGKDEVAEYLSAKHGFTRLAFGDALKDDVAVRFKRTLLAILMNNSSLWVGYVAWLQKHDGLRVTDETKLHWLLRVEKPAIVRELLQEYATEVRRADDPAYWTERLHARRLAWLDAHAGPIERLVIPDVRFPNEVAYIRGHQGWLWRISRAGTSFGSDKHVSEHGLLDVTADASVINPNNDIPTLHMQIEHLLGDIRMPT